LVLDYLDKSSKVRFMPETPLTWQMVDAVATRLGANSDARLKWRQRGRGVPAAWRIKIAESLKANGVHIELSAFDCLPETPGRIAA
jgi:hypothetical protein